MLRRSLLALFIWGMFINLATAQTREEKVRSDREKVQADGFWIYNDLAEGRRQARESGKPILVVLRCIPCEECVKLDEELMHKDKELLPLLEQFVRVRQVSTNGLDLSLFQYDYDQSFAVFMMNADDVIYGRFGTRSHRTVWSEDVSIPGLAAALRGALELHQNYPANKQALADKRGPRPEFPSPEKYPLLRGKFSDKLNYEGNVVKSCIHCHQIGDAQRDYHLREHGKIPDKLLFQYPHPKTIGLILDPTEKAAVREVADGSPAAKAGFRAGDEILSLQGQPLLSIADVQWVLHHSKEEDQLAAQIRRDGKTTELKLALPQGWRRKEDLSWRVSSWPLRRMNTGGLVLELATPEQRKAAGIDSDAMALRVKHVGQYGPHAAAKRAGFRVGDVVISYDGRDDLHRETDLLAYAAANHKAGDRVNVRLIRGKKELQLKLPIQE